MTAIKEIAACASYVCGGQFISGAKIFFLMEFLFFFPVDLQNRRGMSPYLFGKGDSVGARP